MKLAGATRPVLAHLARLDRLRSDRQRREIAIQVWARSTPSILSGLLPIAAWALYLTGDLSAGATLVAVSTLGAARWFAWTTASLISQLPSARVWTRRTVAMSGVARLLGRGAGRGHLGRHRARAGRRRRGTRCAGWSWPASPPSTRTARSAARDVDLTVDRGELVLVVGPVGAGKSSLLRALAGIVHHTGALRWNGEPVTEPELFLRPNQVGYVGQLPRVLSGSVADNIQLGHDVEATAAVTTAQLDHDLAAAGSGLGLLIGHKGTRLSGGQLQRLALARALAPRTELLIADDVSSALDVTTELALWRALRERGLTVIGSTSKRAALRQADKVVVLIDGEVVAQGPWPELETPGATWPADARRGPTAPVGARRAWAARRACVRTCGSWDVGRPMGHANIPRSVDRLERRDGLRVDVLVGRVERRVAAEVGPARVDLEVRGPSRPRCSRR